jgi:hypothetical protein
MTVVTMREVLDSTLEDVAHVETLAVEVARRVGFRGAAVIFPWAACRVLRPNALKPLAPTAVERNLRNIARINRLFVSVRRVPF